MSLKELRQKRARLQGYVWFVLPLVVVGGWFYPLLGFFLLFCMAGALLVAIYNGRAWCDWMCPRGSFYDLFLSRLSPKKAVPAVLRRRGVRVAVLSLLIGTLGGQLYLAWPEPEGMGLAMVRLLTMTTAVGLLAGVVVHHRLWCHICPVGTIGSWLSRGRRLHIRGECTNCGVCSKLCPMQLRPYRFSPGVMTDGDCIKCSMCVSACPRKALGFGDGFKEAA